MNSQSMHIYEFGPFRLDPAERLLLRDGAAVPLTPKVFDLLHALVERPGHLLEKDELMKVVWPDTIVEEGNLSNNISILRKTLGANGEQFIETVPKRGYRFVASVREQAAESGIINDAPTAVVDATTEQPGAQPPAWRISPFARRRLMLAILLSILLIGVAGAISYWPAARQPAAPRMAINSIAVLPLRALHSSERDESLEMGAASILIARLGSLRQLI